MAPPSDEAGFRAFDISGELRGDLRAQAQEPYLDDLTLRWRAPQAAAERQRLSAETELQANAAAALPPGARRGIVGYCWGGTVAYLAAAKLPWMKWTCSAS